MFDVSHLPNVNNGADIQVFKTPGVFPWYKPRGKSLITMLLIGGGGGGGGGFAGAAATARSGGGGGSSGIAKLSIPAAFLPEILFCQVGLGGLGGDANIGGAAGDFSAVTLNPNNKTDAPLRVVFSGSGTTSGGGAGTAAAAGAAGGAGAAPATGITLAQIGSLVGNSGQAGSAGGAPTGSSPAAIVGFTTGTMGGCGGAGLGTTATEYAGGGISAAAPFLAVPGGILGGGRGVDGYERNFSPLYLPTLFQASIAGTGGGSSNAGVGGNGGNGGIGSGGGGGGAGVTAGRGGNGGNGMIMIVSV
jgi:hypothetical protein